MSAAAPLLAAVIAAALLTPGDLPPAEVVIQADGLRPTLLEVEPERRVIFRNQSGRRVHLEIRGRAPDRHHVVQVPESIWAVFHSPGAHPYTVHFLEAGLEDLAGMVQVVWGSTEGPELLVCSGITVMGGCFER